MKPLKVLILDNTREESSFGSKNLVRWAIASTPVGSEVLVRRSPDSDLPTANLKFNALVISGSITSCMESNEGWIKPYDEFVTNHIKLGTPILGVCYGHQTIARCLSRMNGHEPKFRNAAEAELGWQEIRITESTPLLEGLSGSFFTYESHYEEVYEVPAGLKKFAESDRCGIQGFQLEDKPVFGVQFHPEYPCEEAEKSIAIKIKKGVNPKWILNAGKGEKLFDENVGKVIFGNFFRIAGSQQ